MVSARRSPPANAGAPLSAVPSTLRIPLAARAFGDALFPQVAVGDAFAAAWLAAIGDDGAQWLVDRPSVYGVLARTRVFRERAAAYLAQHPAGQLAILGCGLSHYFQWLDNGRCRLVEGDLQEVVDIRRRLAVPSGERHSLAVVDLRQGGWWDRLGLPAHRSATPVFLMCEGVLMYLQSAQVGAILAEFGERAPAGSVFVCDALSALAVGNARLHPSIRHTGAEFAWAPARLDDLTAPHARLQLHAVNQVMDGYAPLYALMGMSFQFFTGVPFYALYELRVQDAAP